MRLWKPHPLTPSAMNPDAYVRSPRLHPLLSFIDLTLPSAQRTALIAIAAGFSRAELSALPGLKNRARLNATLAKLVSAGRLRLTSTGYEAVPSAPPSEQHLLRAIKSQRKLRRIIEVVLDPAARLRARALTHVAESLGPVLSETLAHELSNAEAMLGADQAVRRRRRCFILAFVERNVINDDAVLTSAGLRPFAAPSDILKLTIDAMPSSREQEIVKLYHAVQTFGEEVLALWWSILTGLQAQGYRSDALWQNWRYRLEAYLLRRRLSLSDATRLQGIHPQELKFTYPVPDCGYGPWVEHELLLWRRFNQLFRPAMGPYTHDLWIRAHGAMSEELRREYPGSDSRLVGREHYDDVLFRVAKTLSGLSTRVLHDLSRGVRSRQVRKAYARAQREWVAMHERAALLKAARHARDGNPSDLRMNGTGGRSWACNLLRIAAQRAAGIPVDGAEFANLVHAARFIGNRGGSRLRQARLSEYVLRTLNMHFRSSPIHIAPGEKFPLERIRSGIQAALASIDEAHVHMEERLRAIRSLAEYVERRACIEVIYADGVSETRTIDEAAQFTGNAGGAASLFAMFANVDVTERTDAVAA